MTKVKIKARYQKVTYQTMSILSISFLILYIERLEVYLLLISLLLASGLFQKHIIYLVKNNMLYRYRLGGILVTTFLLGWFISPSLVAIPSSIAMWWLSWVGIRIMES
ncbi:hypothetical protein [Vibrio sp. 10N.222.54.B11]|uniref:hypothetical protein n=1 Tax=Vibrio sp. 10N.222.54.B11 TaxID=3229635 RepID=UPI00354B134A